MNHNDAHGDGGWWFGAVWRWRWVVEVVLGGAGCDGHEVCGRGGYGRGRIKRKY